MADDDFIKNFVPWKGNGSTEGLNTSYTSTRINGFTPGDIVTAPSTNAALRMATLICSAVANLFNLDGLTIDSNLASVLSTMTTGLNNFLDKHAFKSQITFEEGASFKHTVLFGGSPNEDNNLTFKVSSKLIVEPDPPTVSGRDVFQNLNYGIGNFNTIIPVNDNKYVRGLESTFLKDTASYETDPLPVYTVLIHSAIDLQSENTTATADTSTIFEIQDTGNPVFYVRPTGSTRVKDLRVFTVENNNHQGVMINPAQIEFTHKDGSKQWITWEDFFKKLDTIKLNETK